MLLSFALQTFLVLIWTASITSSGAFFLGFTKTRLIAFVLLSLIGIATLILFDHHDSHLYQFQKK
jgi:hypothetical protein